MGFQDNELGCLGIKALREDLFEKFDLEEFREEFFHFNSPSVEPEDDEGGDGSYKDGDEDRGGELVLDKGDGEGCENDYEVDFKVAAGEQLHVDMGFEANMVEQIMDDHC